MIGQLRRTSLVEFRYITQTFLVISRDNIASAYRYKCFVSELQEIQDVPEEWLLRYTNVIGDVDDG